MLDIGAVVWGVQDVPRSVDFWSKALNYRLKYPASEGWSILVPVQGSGIQLSLNKVSSPKARRHHLDLFTDDQEGEVERLLALGATGG